MPSTASPRHGRCCGFVAGLALLTAGCGGSATLNQRLAGEWVGRPETAAERVLREWPAAPDAVGEAVATNPEIAAAIAVEPVTDLEAVEVTVRMSLGMEGGAKLSLDGAAPLEGDWRVEPLDGGRAILELAVARPTAAEPVVDGAAGEAETTEAIPTELRRFDLQFLAKGEGFVLRESGADRRFGRLLFRRPESESGDGPSSATQAESDSADPAPANAPLAEGS